jgi:hypothetical protein
MTTVQIKFSQRVVDEMLPASSGSELEQGELSVIFDAAVLMSSAIDQAYPSYSSWSFANGVLRFNLDQDAYLTYSGVQLADPTAPQGTAIATTRAFSAPNEISMTQTGAFKLQYSVTSSPYGDQLAVEALPGTVLNGFSVSTHFPVWSEDYDPSVGNLTFGLNGSITLNDGNTLSGTLSRISMSADKFIVAGLIEGSFQVVADIDAINEGFATSTVTGTMNSYRADFIDGSFLHLTGASIYMSNTDALNAAFFADAANFTGDDDISIEMPEFLYEDLVIAAGAGADRIAIGGGGGKLHVAAGDGADNIAVTSGAHKIDGGAEIDFLTYSGARNGFTVKSTATGFTVTDSMGAVSTLMNIERMKFGDATIALDITGNAGQAYRLYQAAFNRTPDSAGLGFWINALDHGVSLTAIAAGFTQSTEYQQAYGGMLTNRELITRYYENILHRAPEQAGADFWVDVLDRQAASVASVLAAISESAENQAGVLPVIGNGFPYTPYG